MEIPESIQQAWRMRCHILAYVAFVEKKLHKLAVQGSALLGRMHELIKSIRPVLENDRNWFKPQLVREASEKAKELDAVFSAYEAVIDELGIIMDETIPFRLPIEFGDAELSNKAISKLIQKMCEFADRRWREAVWAEFGDAEAQMQADGSCLLPSGEALPPFSL